MNRIVLIFIVLLAGVLPSSQWLMAQHHSHNHSHDHHDQPMSDAHIAGHVLDAHTGEHLSFVNVQVEGTTLGCVTDESGHFYLKNLPVGDLTIVFSMIVILFILKSLYLVVT